MPIKTNTHPTTVTIPARCPVLTPEDATLEAHVYVVVTAFSGEATWAVTVEVSVSVNTCGVVVADRYSAGCRIVLTGEETSGQLSELINVSGTVGPRPTLSAGTLVTSVRVTACRVVEARFRRYAFVDILLSISPIETIRAATCVPGCTVNTHGVITTFM